MESCPSFFFVVGEWSVVLNDWCSQSITIEPRHEKTNILVSDLFRQKPGCAASEDC